MHANGSEIVPPVGGDAPEIAARFSDPAGNVIGLYQQPAWSQRSAAWRWQADVAKLKPLRTFGTPSADIFGTISYVQMQSMFDAFFPPGRRTYAKANFLRSLDAGTIDALLEYVGKSPSTYTFGPGSNTGMELPPAWEWRTLLFPIGSRLTTFLSGRTG
jgi:hypothetical protein